MGNSDQSNLQFQIVIVNLEYLTSRHEIKFGLISKLNFVNLISDIRDGFGILIM